MYCLTLLALVFVAFCKFLKQFFYSICWFVPDVIGVVKVCNDTSTVIGKQSQKEITKRDLQIVDQSGVAINLTLWGNDVSTHNSVWLLMVVMVMSVHGYSEAFDMLIKKKMLA